MNNLKNKVIVITGASRGIGKALTNLFINEGAKIAICSRNKNDLEIFKTEFFPEKKDSEIFLSSCDVSNSDEVSYFIKKVYDKFNKIDILINNAAIGVFDKIEDLKMSDWKNLIDTNLNGSFYFCHESIPIIKKNNTSPKGYILNMGSISHNFLVNQNAAYSSSKAALKTLSDHLFNELRTDDILVSYIAAGSVNTNFSKRNPDLKGWKIKPDDIANFIIKIVKDGYLGYNYCNTYFEIKTKFPLKIETFKE